MADQHHPQQPHQTSKPADVREHHTRPKQPSEKAIDKGVEDTFPASDPTTTHGGVTKIKEGKK